MEDAVAVDVERHLREVVVHDRDRLHRAHADAGGANAVTRQEVGDVRELGAE
jgi:hypothetical protein